MSRATELADELVEYSVTTKLHEEAAALLRQQDAVIRQCVEALKECNVNPEDFDFGPAYSGAIERRKAALAAAKGVL